MLPRFLNRDEAETRINDLAKEKIPFLFILSYDTTQNWIIPLSEVDPNYICYDFNGVTNVLDKAPDLHNAYDFEKFPMDLAQYEKGFRRVLEGLQRGDSFLTNYTVRTPITCSLSNRAIFELTQAKYRLWVKGHFCCFSPEIFVQIKKDQISTFPMKGTLDAQIAHAHHVLLNDPKEKAEHATIVDLMRNDLSQIADQVKVVNYRYIDTLKTDKGALLQVSSHIRGELHDHVRQALGTSLFQLLPAGSISGAPKDKTCQIIAAAEPVPRGFYTGVAGLFDGENLDSGVLIRYITDDESGNRFFHSGGGITANSCLEKEYEEVIQKAYLPLRRNHCGKS